MQDHISIMRPPYAASSRFDATSYTPWESAPLGHIAVWHSYRATKELETAQIAHELAQRRAGIDLLVILPPSNSPALLPTLLATNTVCPNWVVPYRVRDERWLLQLTRLSPANPVLGLTEYLRFRGLLRTEWAYESVPALLTSAHGISSVNRWVKRLNTSRRSLGRNLSRAGLPRPSHWLQFSRLLRALQIMHQSRCSVSLAATQVGYPDPFTLSNQMKRLTGLRPSEAREFHGWNWFVERWLEREVATGGINTQLYPGLAHHNDKTYEAPDNIASWGR